MGIVYLAEHTLIGRKAAVKVLRPEYSSSPAIVDRFFNEARAMAATKHPGVIDVLDFGHHTDGSAFIVMEFLEGESLSSRLARERTLPAAVVVEIARQVALAVSAAHAVGVVHRDLKPDNVFLVPSDELQCGLRAKVLDFGIAKLTGDNTYGQKTRTGALIGTPAYMSPEQCRGAGQVDHRTDIYALGCMMFEMVCGRQPFVGEGPGDVIVAHMCDEPLAPSSLAPGIPPQLETVILRALAKKMETRHQTMAEVVRDLDTLAPGRLTNPGFATVGAAAVIASTPVAPTLTELPQKAPATTTLGGSAGQVAASPLIGTPAPTSRKRRNRLWLLGGSATLVVAAGAAAVVLVGRDSHPLQIAPTAKPTAMVHSPATVAPLSPATLPSVPALPKVDRVALKIDSEPANADVFHDGDARLVGTTPLTEQVDAKQGEAKYVVKNAGFVDAHLTLPTDRDGSARVVLLRRQDAAAQPVASKKVDTATSPASPQKTRKAPSPHKSVKSGVLDPFDN